MKCKTLIGIIVLGILTSMPSTAFGREKKDSLILQRVYEYQRNNVALIDSIEDNVYLKLRFNVEKRNPTLLLVPSIYVLAKGEREYIRESYSKVLFANDHNFDIKSQVLSGTIRRNRRAMPTLLDMLTPNLYDVALYDRYMLSPFNRYNRHYYRYTQKTLQDGTTRLDFRPKLYNTQLLNGYAIIDTATGRIIRTILNGEYDMITFRTEIQQGAEGGQSLMPAKCKTAATFRFLGNRISTLFDATYQNPLSLHDSIEQVSSRELMDSIRPVPLSETDKLIYAAYDERHKPDTLPHDTMPKKDNLLKKIFWDTIGENLVTPIKAESDNGYLRLSPLINPLQLSWSNSRGFRYKIKLRSMYSFSAHRYLTFNPRFGYNFKFREFYFTMPLRMTYNPKRNGYAEVIYGNGNRISNSDVQSIVQRQYGDSIDIENSNIDKFTDYNLTVFNNIMLFDWLDIETGFVYHRRVAINKDIMRKYNMPTEYRSFAPMIGLKITPWQRGPLFSIDWERGITGINKSDIDYNRWEFDASWKYDLPGLQMLNMRAGYGFYTHKTVNYFLDYANFRDNNLPGGWADEWSGNFELLSRKAYNSSNYYLRYNISFDSPLMIGSFVPYLGKYLERERFYLGTAITENSRPYFEVGYSFTNRYISIGAFAGFRGSAFQRIGFDFEYELFKRW